VTCATSGYHQACDTYANINLFASDVNVDAVACSTLQYAMSAEDVNGVAGEGRLPHADDRRAQGMHAKALAQLCTLDLHGTAAPGTGAQGWCDSGGTGDRIFELRREPRSDNPEL